MSDFTGKSLSQNKEKNSVYFIESVKCFRIGSRVFRKSPGNSILVNIVDWCTNSRYLPLKPAHEIEHEFLTFILRVTTILQHNQYPILHFVFGLFSALDGL